MVFSCKSVEVITWSLSWLISQYGKFLMVVGHLWGECEGYWRKTHCRCPASEACWRWSWYGHFNFSDLSPFKLLSLWLCSPSKAQWLFLLLTIYLTVMKQSLKRKPQNQYEEGGKQSYQLMCMGGKEIDLHQKSSWSLEMFPLFQYWYCGLLKEMFRVLEVPSTAVDAGLLMH